MSESDEPRMATRWHSLKGEERIFQGATGLKV